MAHPSLIACHECDLLQHPAPVPPRGAAKCARCNALLYRVPGERGIENAFAVLIAALILFVVANIYPILSMELQGQRVDATILGGVRELNQGGMPAIAAIVFLTGFLFPLANLLGMLAVLLPFVRRRRPRYLATLLRGVMMVRPWSMIEVFMLGVFVSMVKLAHLAHVVPGLAMAAFVLLIVLLASAATVIDPQYLWSRWESLE